MTIGDFTLETEERIAIDMSTVSRVTTGSGLTTIWTDDGLFFNVKEDFDDVVGLWKSMEDY